MSHSHKVQISLTRAEIESVAGLADRLPPYVNLAQADTIPKAWGCAHSCNWVKIFGVSFLVDFTSGSILDDPDSRPCERSDKGKTAAGGAASTPAHKAVKHSRVDPLGHLDKFRQEGLRRPPQMSIHDEALMTEIGAERGLQMQFPDKVPPGSFLVALRTLAIQVAELVSANNAVIAATVTKEQEKKVKSVTIRGNAVTPDAANAPVSIDIILKNNIVLGCLLRGLLEFADHCQLMHRTLYSTVGFHVFMSQLSSNMRPDIVEITAVIQSPEEIIKDVGARLDGNTFYVAGALAATRQKPALEEFFRKESGRFVTVAKACGWKPPADKKADGSPSPRNPGPGNRKRTIADSQATDSTNTAPPSSSASPPGSGKSRNAKMRRKKAAAAKAGDGTGK